MGLQIYCGKGFDTQKAERFFKERRVSYQRVDVLRYGIGKRELESVAAAVGLEALCDRQSKAFRESVIAYTQNRDAHRALWEAGDGGGVPRRVDPVAGGRFGQVTGLLESRPGCASRGHRATSDNPANRAQARLR